MSPPFLDWSLTPTVVPWTRRLASITSAAELLDLWTNPPLQYSHGLPSPQPELWLRFLLAHAALLDVDFLSRVIPSFIHDDWVALRTNSSALTDSSWALIRHHTLERCIHHHLPKATIELDIIDWLINHAKIEGTEPEVRAVLDIILDPETDGTPGLLAIPCYPLLERLATLPGLPADLVIRLSQVAEYLRAPRGPKKHALLEPTTDLRLGLLNHPACTEDIAISLLQYSNDPAVFLAVASTPRWGQNRTVQQAILMLEHVPADRLEPIIVAITNASAPKNLVGLLTDIDLVMQMQGKDPLPLMRLFVRTLSPEQVKSLPKKALVWLLKNRDREVRTLTTALFKHRQPHASVQSIQGELDMAASDLTAPPPLSPASPVSADAS